MNPAGPPLYQSKPPPPPPPRPTPPPDGSPSPDDDSLDRLVALGRNLVLGLLALGVIMFLILATPTWGRVLVLAALVVVAVLVAPRLPGILRRGQVIDRWDALLVAGHGQAERVVAQTVAALVARRVPQITWGMADLAPGWVRGFAGDMRPFLVVAHTHNPRLKRYRMYVNVRDYGASLQTCWYLAYRLPFWRRVSAISGLATLGLDLFDEQDLRAYVTAVHHAFLDAVVEILAGLGQETSTLQRSSKGFLGIS
jgi:hypothetical protein